MQQICLVGSPAAVIRQQAGQARSSKQDKHAAAAHTPCSAVAAMTAAWQRVLAMLQAAQPTLGAQGYLIHDKPTTSCAACTAERMAKQALHAQCTRPQAAMFASICFSFHFPSGDAGKKSGKGLEQSGSFLSRMLGRSQSKGE